MNTIVNNIEYDPVLFGASPDMAEKSKKVAAEVESLFIFQLLKEMDATVERDEEGLMFSEYEDTYRSLFNQEIAREISKAGGVGIQDMVKSNLTQLGQGLYEEEPSDTPTVSFVR